MGNKGCPLCNCEPCRVNEHHYGCKGAGPWPTPLKPFGWGQGKGAKE